VTLFNAVRFPFAPDASAFFRRLIILLANIVPISPATAVLVKKFETARPIGMEHASCFHGASWRYSIIGISWIATPSDKEGKK
jgi:hypothetical protein